jgi:hypothetical protein
MSSAATIDGPKAGEFKRRKFQDLLSLVKKCRPFSIDGLLTDLTPEANAELAIKPPKVREKIVAEVIKRHDPLASSCRISDLNGLIAADGDADGKPQVCLPGKDVSINDTSDMAGPLVAATGLIFIRSGSVVSVAVDDDGCPATFGLNGTISVSISQS